METKLRMDFFVDKPNRRIHVKREFAAPLATVWQAWTDSKWLDQWWAPKPWKARTQSMDFAEGGRWLYAMVGPEGEEHWSIADYKSIEPQQSFTGDDAFTDADGNINTDMPQTNWQVNFNQSGEHTLVDITLSYDKLEDLEGILEMGFQDGFIMGLGNLDELLEKNNADFPN